MNYAAIKKTDVANGPGVRVSVFVSGCTHRCPGCFNREAWDFGYGSSWTREAQEEALAALRPGYIRGITVLGGEPFEKENAGPVADLLAEVRKNLPQKDVWCYTGYDFEKDLLRRISEGEEGVKRLLELTDVLVDGEFVMAQKDLRLKFRGSGNQRILDVKSSLREGRAVLLCI